MPQTMRRNFDTYATAGCLDTGADQVFAYRPVAIEKSMIGSSHPAHTYTQTGSFTVVLTATAGTESDSETEVDYVTVSAAALASGAQSVPPIRGLQWLGAEDEDMIGRHQVPSLDPAIHTRYTSNAD
jgi:hypothetical protein